MNYIFKWMIVTAICTGLLVLSDSHAFDTFKSYDWRTWAIIAYILWLAWSIHDNAFKAGRTQGYLEGRNMGFEDGYNTGYMSGFLAGTSEQQKYGK